MKPGDLAAALREHGLVIIRESGDTVTVAPRPGAAAWLHQDIQVIDGRTRVPAWNAAEIHGTPGQVAEHLAEIIAPWPPDLWS